MHRRPLKPVPLCPKILGINYEGIYIYRVMKRFLSAIIAAIVIVTIAMPGYTAFKDQKIVKDYTAAKGWTSIVPMSVDSSTGGTDLLSYNAETGHAIVSVAVGISGDQKQGYFILKRDLSKLKPCPALR